MNQARFVQCLAAPPMPHRPAPTLVILFAFNLALQVFDGLATYYGLRLGHGEGNPIVAAVLGVVGNGPGLFAVKAYACACVVMIWQLRGRSALVGPALAATALAYTLGSFGPWSLALAAR